MDNKIDVLYTARLARLSISEEELPRYEQDIENVVKLFNDLPDFENTRMEIDKNNPMLLRSDEVKDSYPQSEMLKNAPKQVGGCIAIPKVIE